MTCRELPDDLSQVTPGVPPWPSVDFRGQVRPESDDERQRLAREFSYVFGHARADVEHVLVLDRFGAYSPPDDDKAVFAVELRLRDGVGYQTHIVKLGSDAEVGRDADNWDDCTRGRHVASRIFAPAWKAVFPGSPRVGVVYRDAYTLFGPGEGKDVAPRWLEAVADDAVFTEAVDPLSVERTVAHIFTDLSLWFYPQAGVNPAAAADFYRNELVSKKTQRNALDLWSADPDRVALRRDALWLFCGRDRPDADHAVKPARYLDPVEVVGWALHARRLPETLVGRGHGDLHGRNVLLGVRRREAEYPAVYDYGGMGRANALAWDFAKLETELKVRLLPKLYGHDAAYDAARAHRAWVGRRDGERPDAATRPEDPLRFFYVFEEMLAERTREIKDRNDAEAWRPPGGRAPTGCPPMDRLLSLLMRVRQEAALALGFLRPGRAHEWRDELLFALAVCGLVHARWRTYTQPQSECALVSAGVAAAHATFVRKAVAEQVQAEAPPPPPYPSYRVPLAHARRMSKEPRHREGKQFLDGLAAQYAHAVPFFAEHALFRCHAGEWKAVQTQLKELGEKARAFGDAETLTRLGRAYKEMGDESWERSGLPFDQLGNHPAVQYYRMALAAYEDAYRLDGHYFPGVNVAGAGRC